MRWLVLVLLTGCATPCEAPGFLDGRTYTLLGNHVRWSPVDAVFPPGSWPTNGQTTWRTRWDVPVEVQIDGQAFDADGLWSDDRCGAFALAFDGTYTSDAGVRHIFSMDVDFLFYDDVLEGVATLSDRWSFGESSGTFEVEEAALTGLLERPSE